MDAGDEGEPQADGVPRGGSEGGEERAIKTNHVASWRLVKLSV